MLIRYKKLNVLTVGEKILVPGNNDVSTSEWAAMLKLYPKVKILIEAGDIEVYGADARPLDEEKAASGKTDDVLESTDITKLNVKRATALVKETVDIALLSAWHDAEKRKPVQEAIEARLEQIASAGETTEASVQQPAGGEA